MAIIKPTLNLVASEYTPEILNVTRASGATRVNAVGLVERVGSGTLRYDYDPTTLAGKGWLIEEARTNLCLYSEDISTSWSNYNTSDSVNQIASPDGNTTADLLDNTTSSGEHSIYQSISFVSGTTYIFSAFFKSNELTHAILKFNGSSHGTSAQVEFDLENLTMVEVSGTILNKSMTQYPNGWVRCEMSSTATSTTAANTEVLTSDGGGAASYSGTAGDGVYVWGISIEAGSFATSYIPTTTAAVTRAVDIMTVNLSDIDFNDGGEGTAYLHAEYPDVSGMGNGSPFALDDGTTADKILMYGQSATNQVHVGGAEQFGGTAGTLPDATPYRYALTWATNNFNYARDGSLFQSADTSGSVPTSLTTIRFGNTPGHIQLKKQHVVHFALFPARLTDADIQTITTG